MIQTLVQPLPSQALATGYSSCSWFNFTVYWMHKFVLGCSLNRLQNGLALGHGFPLPPVPKISQFSSSPMNPLGLNFLTMMMPLGTF